jgi:hypothetical protein
MLLHVQFLNNSALVDGGALILDGIALKGALLYNNTATGNRAVGGRGGRVRGPDADQDVVCELLRQGGAVQLQLQHRRCACCPQR